MKKFLVINDDDAILRLFRRLNNPNVATALCYTIEEAFAAITKYGPEIIFLDHHLTRNGDEGIEIADIVKGVKIYSTTGDLNAIAEYEKRGIEVLGPPFDFEKARLIISKS